MGTIQKFLAGAVIGMLCAYVVIYHGETILENVDSWFDGSASGYRGDSRHQRAREALR